MLFVGVYDAFFFQLTNFGGKPASLYLKVIRKLLTVKGDFKTPAICLVGTKHKVSHKLFAGASFGGYLDFLMKHYVFHRKGFHKVENKLLVKAAVIGAGVQDMTYIYKHNFRRLCGNGAQGNVLHLGTGKGFGKHLARYGHSHNASVTVKVGFHHLHPAGKDYADVFCRIALGDYGVFFVEKLHPCSKAGKHPKQVFCFDTVKKRAGIKNIQIFFHFYHLLLKFQHTLFFDYIIIKLQNQGRY